MEHQPTVTASDLLAADIVQAIDDLAARIPRLQRPHSKTAPQVRGGRTVPDEAILSMIAGVEAEPALQQLGTFDTDSARALLQFSFAFGPVLDRLNGLAAALSFTMESWRAEVASDLLRTYTIMKGLSRDPKTGMIHHVETLRRDLRRTNGARKAAAEG